MTASEADAAAGSSSAPRRKEQKRQEEGEEPLTKRQRRKQRNDTHAWPQHPKVFSPAARAKAYLRTAGLIHPAKSACPDPALDLNSPQVKFCRLLGGTDQRVRHAAVLQLSAYLKQRVDIHNDENTGLSELDLMKLWKGLWYTLYMADKTVIQDELSSQLASLLWSVAGTPEEDEYAGQSYMDMYGDDVDYYHDDDNENGVIMEEIANTLQDDGEDDDNEESADSDDEEEEEEEDDDKDSSSDDNMNQDEEDAAKGNNEKADKRLEELDDSEIPHCRGAHLASLFVRTFFRTLRLSWGNMDKYRVDKFYTLMRLMMRQVYGYMAARHWNLGIIRLFNDAIYEEVLSQTPNGLRYHLIDITLEELAKVESKAPMPLTEATFLDCLEPYFAMAQTGAGDDSVQQRVVENALSKFLEEYSVVSDSAIVEKGDEDNERLIFTQVHVGTVAQFIFCIASDLATKDAYRKSLYDLHKTYMRRLKKVGRDVDLDADDEESDEQMESDQDDGIAGDDHDIERVGANNKEDQPVPKTKKQAATQTRQEIKQPADAEQNEDDSQKKTKRKKRKKKKKRGHPASSVDAEGEEEVTISAEDQKAAKAAMQPKHESAMQPKLESKVAEKKKAGPSKKKRKRKAESDHHEGGTQNDDKRVKFKKSNFARTWKASMKALRNAEPPAPQATPEKGILLNKGAKAKIQKNKHKERKKATDYFGFD